MRPTPILLPGNMCDARLWCGDGDVVRKMFARRDMDDVRDADLTQDDSIAAMAGRALAATEGDLLLVGFSMGAIVAVEMAVQATERIVGLERVLVEELKPNYLAVHNRNDATLLDLLRDMGMSLGDDVFVRQSEALRLRADRRAAITALKIPVLYLCGSEDALCPPGWHQQWAAQTPRAHFEEIAGAGHMLPLDAPASVAAAIELWFTNNEGILSDG